MSKKETKLTEELEEVTYSDSEFEQKTEVPQLLHAGVSQDQLDLWKEKYKEVHIITVRLNEHESLTGYFKKPDRNIMANCINLAQDKKNYEAREFLLNNTFIGGDKTITTNFDAAVSAATKLWGNINFLIAEATIY
jgi:hypothetical protein